MTDGWTGAPSVALGGRADAEHEYAVVRDGARFAFRYDGRDLARVQAEPGDYALRIGSDALTWAGSWSTVALGSLSLRCEGDPPQLTSPNKCLEACWTIR